MFRHPSFFSAEVGRDAERKALLAEQDVSAVAGVDRPDGVVLREMADVAVLLVELRLRVKTLDETGVVAERVENVVPHAGHNQHIQNDVDRVGQLDAVLRERRTDDPHGVRDDVHRLPFHRAVIEFRETSVAFLRVDPVIDITGVLLFACADEGTPLHARDVVDRGSVQVAPGEKILIQFRQLAGGTGLAPEFIRLLFGTVDPEDFRGTGHLRHLVNPIQYVPILCG